MDAEIVQNEGMERRKSERVQFFQVSTDQEIRPVWVFRQTYPEAILGLMIDIAPDGAQILTSRSPELTHDAYLLAVHAGNRPMMANIRRIWSRPDGTLYARNGFSFDDRASLKSVLLASGVRPTWLRCELLPMG